MAVVIAAPSSRSGKTTITLALLAALRRRGVVVQSFKVGPDYIDPMFHEAVTGLPCRNLDPVLTSESYVKDCFRYHCQGRHAALIEGVMGLFDGKASPPSWGSLPDQGSTAHVARLLDQPVILVVDARGMSTSIAALIYGFRHLDRRVKLAGVILNRVGSPRHEEMLRIAVASQHLPVLGCVGTIPEIALPSRHLGLVPVDQLTTFAEMQTRLADLAEAAMDWAQLLPLLCDLPPPADPLWDLDGDPFPGQLPPRIAIASDQAFNFYYADHIDLLKASGAQLSFYSPLQEGLLPRDPCDGVYLGGGFPELFASQLSERFVAHPLPPRLPLIYAECGGLMVLGETLWDLAGDPYRMSGVLPLQTKMTERLTLGYRHAQTLRATPFFPNHLALTGHEFHHSQSLNGSISPIYAWDNHREGWASDRIHASYLHLHWGSAPVWVQRWLRHCQAQRGEQ
ncbi:MAG: cobyrinate a,c-diamide synthase [Cyanobacteriota bacterium]|nr:cobyrinate a,c-diamide synthase [Cyanobacteriota bacterium]